MRNGHHTYPGYDTPDGLWHIELQVDKKPQEYMAQCNRNGCVNKHEIRASSLMQLHVEMLKHEAEVHFTK